jgi:hypothetical protein
MELTQAQLIAPWADVRIERDASFGASRFLFDPA